MLDQPADVLVDVAGAAGFDGVGLRISDHHAVTNPEEIRRRGEQIGISVHDTEVHRIALDHADPAALIEQSAALGARALLAVSDLPDHGATVDAVHDLTLRCERQGVRLALEYMAWTTPNDPVGAIEIAGLTGCVLVVDLLHHVRVGAGPAELRAIVESGALGWVQLCDAPLARPTTDQLVTEARHGRMCPGDGELPLGELLACLPDGVTISVEVQSDALIGVAPGERAKLLHDRARALLAS